MKKIFLSLIVVAIACGMNAQTVKIMNGETVVAAYTSSQYSKVVFEEEVAPQYTYVDLGLSVKWATMNVGATNGATKESWYGDYFAWGETTAKSDYSWSTYSLCNGSDGTMTKYCTNSSYGTVDNKTVLEAVDDAATVNWGGSWRMPTLAEQDELRNKCTWVWTTNYQGISGLNGYVVIATNGNFIFLPSAGRRIDSSLDHAGSYGNFRSASLYEDCSNYAYYIGFDSGSLSRYYGNRYIGESVRPVCQ